MPWKHIIVSLPAKHLQMATSAVSSVRQSDDCQSLQTLLNLVDQAAFLTSACDAQLHIMTVSEDAAVSEYQQEILRCATERGTSLANPVCSVLTPDTWSSETPQLSELSALMVADISENESSSSCLSGLPTWYLSEHMEYSEGISTVAVVPPHCLDQAIVEFVNLAIHLPLRLTLLAGSEERDRDRVFAAIEHADVRSTEFGVQVAWIESNLSAALERQEFDLLMTMGAVNADVASVVCKSRLALPGLS